MVMTAHVVYEALDPDRPGIGVRVTGPLGQTKLQLASKDHLLAGPEISTLDSPDVNGNEDAPETVLLIGDKVVQNEPEAGAEDVREDGDNFEVITEPGDFEKVRAAIEAAGIPAIDAEVTMLPQTSTSLQGKEADQMIRLMDMLDDCEDVQKVYTNADIPEELI